jgi:hypothetical protein
MVGLVTPRPVLVALAVTAACGPRGASPPPVPPPAAVAAAALVVTAPDAATLARTEDVLAPMVAGRLAAIRIGIGEPWPVAELAARGVAVEAPLGAALTADGVAIRWATVASAEQLARAFAAAPDATRWTGPDGQLWKIGAATIAVIARGRAAVITEGAPSTRERVALALAAGAVRVDTTPAPGGLAVELEAGLLLDLFVEPEPGDLLDQVGADLGRIHATLVAAPERVAVEVVVAPRPGTLAERLIAGAQGTGAPIARGPFALSTRLAPAEVARVLEELGPRGGVDAAYLLNRTPLRAGALTGELSLGPGGVGVRVVDQLTAVQYTSNALVIAPNGLVFGRDAGHSTGAGLNLPVEAVAAFPLERKLPQDVGDLVDENTDVPWSQEYRAARTQFAAAEDKLGAARSALNAAWRTAQREWNIAWGPAVVVPLAPTGTGYRGRGEWRPPGGTIAAAAAAAAAKLAQVEAAEQAHLAALAAAAAARERAIAIRARDVSAWDRRHR